MYSEPNVSWPVYRKSRRKLGHYLYDNFCRIFAAIQITDRRCETAHVDLVLARAQ